MQFFQNKKLPKPLSAEELKHYFELYKNGDEQAFDVLVEHNLKLVISIVSKYNSSKYDLDELAETGVIGLIKAINTFDISNGTKFSTYAGLCISNEINMFLRKVRKDENNISIEETIATGKNGNEQTLEDTLSDNVNLILDYEKKEQILIIRKLVDELPSPDKEIIKLYYGFYNDNCYTQQEIADKIGFSRVYISRIINKNIKILAKKLHKMGSIETTKKIKISAQAPTQNKNLQQRIKVKLEKINDNFSHYSKDQILQALQIYISELPQQCDQILVLLFNTDKSYTPIELAIEVNCSQTNLGLIQTIGNNHLNIILHIISPN